MKAYIHMEMRTLLATAFVFLSAHALADEPASPKLRPKITLSKATTRVTGPLTKDGYIDYVRVINQRLSVGVTAENNANVLLWKAMGPHPEETNLGPRLFKLMKTEMLPETGDYFMSLDLFLTKQLKLTRSDDAWKQSWNAVTRGRLWTAADHPRIAAWLRFNEKPLALVSEASRRSRYYAPLIVDSQETKPTGNAATKSVSTMIEVLLPGAQVSRQFARALASRAMLRLADNQPEAAWADIIACHRLGHLVAEGPTVIETLVGHAIAGIAAEATLVYIDHVKPNARESALLAKQLDQLPMFKRIAEKINFFDRYMHLDIIQRVAGANKSNMKLLIEMTGLDNSKDSSIKKVMSQYPLYLTDWNMVLKSGNDTYDQLVKTMRIENLAAQKSALEQFEDNLQSRSEKLKSPLRIIGEIAASENGPQGLGKVVDDVLTSILLPSLSRLNLADHQASQIHDHLLVALALAVYHADHGEYPANLAALKPRYLEELPIDRFSGKALIYRPGKQGYLFYSIGRNEKDEQGQSFGDEPAGDDLRVEMPRKQ